MGDQEPGDGLQRLRLRVRLWIYGIALVFIVLAIGLLILPDLIKGYPLVPDSLATYCFFGIGLFSLCVFVSVIWLRRKFPINWIMSCSIAACLALGTVCVLSEQPAGHALLLSLEILIMMALLLLIGSLLLPQCPNVAYLFLTWFIFVVLSSVLMVAVAVHLEDRLLVYEVTVHFVLWQVGFPVAVFQAQVISGFWGNLPPLLDKPLCSTMLLLDFLACYAVLDSAPDIGYELFYVSRASNQKFMARVIERQM
ncbi:uncharacterized protein LOC108149453 [Drosophila elegans]|uniref:uncharacterized protein LOC108149453 n=1 Tax=Drosophila elegans TaxID=30023 RepID=UPI0007E5F000|nr:uncharacterized protein LOC108149453 [Drosophila elegans]